jgi:hypothetical protein
MRCEDIEDRLIDITAAGLASPDPEVRHHLDVCRDCRAAVERATRAWTLLPVIPEPEPDSAAMRIRFATMLERHRRGSTVSWRRWRPAYGVAAALVALIAGAALGRQFPAGAVVDPGEFVAVRRELREVKALLTLSLMQQSAASERIKGVTSAARMDDPTADVVSALLDTLALDPSVNVRLASIRALERFSSRPPVRTAVAQAVTREQSPLVTIALIDFIVGAMDRDAIEPLRQLSRDGGRDDAVRETAARAVQRLLGGGGI